MNAHDLERSQVRYELTAITADMFELGSLKGIPRSIGMIGERQGFIRRLLR